MTFSILLNVERRGKNVKATYPHRGAESQAEHPVKRFPKNTHGGEIQNRKTDRADGMDHQTAK